MASRIFSRISLPIRVTLFIVVVCALLIGSDIWRSVTSRQDQMEEMSVAAANLARAMAQHADDTIKQADTTLVGVVERVEHDGVGPAALDRLHRIFMQRVTELPQLNGLYLYDRDGNWLANSQPVLVKTFNNADREYFIYHRTHTDRSPHVGMPVQSRSTGKWIIPVSRRIDGADGQFAGVVLATIDIDFFSRFYDSLDIGRYGAVALVADNGIMIVRRPFETRFVGKNIVDTMLYKTHQQSAEPGGAGRFVSKSAQDGVTRLNSVRSLSQYPLFVAAALAQDEILAPWWSDTLWHAAGTTVLVTMLAVFGWRLVRNANARTRIERKLAASLETRRAILDTAVNPIITLDRSGVILSLNPAGEKAFGYAEHEIAGKDVRVLVSGTVNELFDRYAAQFTDKNNPEARDIASECELAGLRKDGSVFPVHVSTGSMVTGGERRFVCVITDMTVQIRERAELSEARDQLLLAADIAELGIWAWEFSNDALRWNPRMFEIFGYTSTPAEGLRFEHWLSRVHEDDRSATVEQLEAAFAGELTSKHIHLPLYRIVLPNGETRHIQTTFTVQRDASGNPVGMTGVNHDVTEQRNIELRLRDAKQQADAANEAKSAFLANMSHEIRTPLNAVLGMLDLVQSTGLNERQGGYVVKAEKAAKSLLGLLNDILDYSKIEAGKLQLDTHTFEIEPLMQDLGVVLSGNQYDKEVEVLFDISPDLPPMVIGDSLRLQQVLVNLAGNALKFTIKGQVVVSFTLLSRLDSGVRVRIAVTDSGIGISAAQLGQIFEGFSQAEVSTTRRFGGTGLGLAISRRLVELMGGRLEVASELGKGSRFWFDINLGVSEDVPVDHIDPYLPRDRRLRVLVADDNGIAREVLSRTARALGWEADVVPGGISAVKLMSAAERENEGYDVILLDWRMPDLDGLAAARRIDDARAGRSTPAIVMITAYGQEVLAAAQESDDMPFDAFVTKPVTPKQLAQTVQRVLTGQKPVHVKRAPVAPAGAGRLAGLRLLVVEDNPLNREVAEGLLSREGAQVALAESGLEGVEKVLTGTRVFDAVLMDMQMPDVDGLEATRLIRAHERFAALPIIAMTANATRADRDACLAAGMNDHVGKPIDVTQLVDTLLAHTRVSLPPASTANARANEEPAANELLELKESIVGRFGGSEDLIRKALGVFVGEMERHLDGLRTQAGPERTGRSAALLHAIKGSAGTMGAKALAGHAAALEHRVIEADGDVTACVSPTEVDKLERLLLDSVAQLRIVFGGKQNVPAVSAAQMQADEYRERLGRLLERLEASNLEAIDLAETLAPHVPSALQPRFGQLLAEIEALDFVTAAASTREMLDQLTC